MYDLPISTLQVKGDFYKSRCHLQNVKRHGDQNGRNLECCIFKTISAFTLYTGNSHCHSVTVTVYGESWDSTCEKSWVPVQNHWVPVQKTSPWVFLYVTTQVI